MRASCLLILISFSLFGQTLQFWEPGNHATGLADAGSALNGATELIWKNPAVGNLREKFKVLLYHGHPWNLPEVSHSGFAFTFSSPWGNGGVALSSLYTRHYRENQGILCWSIPKPPLTFGLGFRVFNLSIHRYGEAATGLWDAGVQCQVAAQWRLAASARNLFRATLGKNAIPMTRLLRWALAFSPSSALDIAWDVRFSASRSASSSVAFRLAVHPQISLKTGWRQRPEMISLGIEFRWTPFSISQGLLYHPDLGDSHFTSLEFGQ